MELAGTTEEMEIGRHVALEALQQVLIQGIPLHGSNTQSMAHKLYRRVLDPQQLLHFPQTTFALDWPGTQTLVVLLDPNLDHGGDLHAGLRDVELQGVGIAALEVAELNEFTGFLHQQLQGVILLQRLCQQGHHFVLTQFNFLGQHGESLCAAGKAAG